MGERPDRYRHDPPVGIGSLTSMVAPPRKTPSSNRKPIGNSPRRDSGKPGRSRERPDSPSRSKFKKYNEIRELKELKEVYAAKDLLFKSKKDNPKKLPEVSEGESGEENAPPPPVPVLLKEKSPWKNKTLGESSLLHLLVLNILYARYFHGFSQGEIFDWLCDNHSFFLVQDVPSEMKSQTIARVEEIENKREEIIGEITPYLVGWHWDRLPPLRQLILITAWQFIRTSSPREVPDLLNDAINHAKWFGDDKDYAFVNSILDKLISENQLWLGKGDPDSPQE